ncbi:type II secretion system protein [Microbulbifer sp. YPW16]|uniref:type II secretion system protein n=1 Tax=unclassified Microbulbifer TaxID=2619833 RepID=UPI001E3624E2|nr:type II secretion system protein [Microbulbifer sp. YPW16]UHQ55750.1 type II secretion system GspH family protein [Microbulbifer sp. YPW16]
MGASLRRSRGFTLIELLVVIVIIATLAGMAVISLGSAGHRVWTGETQRLANILRLVADRAVIDKAHYGVRLERGEYSVVRFEPATMRWEKPGGKGAGRSSASRFAAHRLPDNIRLEVLEQAELPGAEESAFAPAGSGDDEAQVPQFVALSSGEVLPVELAVILVENGDYARAAKISYSSLNGLELEWQADDL